MDSTLENALLGNLAKFASTGSLTTFLTVTAARLQRWYLQSLARELLPNERVAKCLHKPIPGAPGVNVMYAPRVERAHYKGLQVCGSVWMCPVCAAKITARRRQELTQAIGAWDGQLVMVTYTLRHTTDDRLSTVLDALLGAYRAMKSGRAWQLVIANNEWFGSVRGLEVTHGRNGFHPHLHEVAFLGKGVDPVALQNELRAHWLRQLDRAGRDASWDRGVLVESADDRIADYVAKYGHDPVDVGWTITHEIASGMSKLGRTDGLSMWQVLAAYGENVRYGRPDDWPAHTFIDYAQTFKGRSQLQWSRGLRGLLHLDEEISDEELALREEEESIVLAQLTRRQWEIILGNDARMELLLVAESAMRGGDPGLLHRWLADLGIEVALPDGAA